jgi:hypothetical protein
MDDAVSLLRRAPLALLSIYYLGTLPCCLALIYFCFDMTQSADAELHLAPEALIFTFSYVWMKTCQAVFARKLLALLEGEDAEPWTPRRWANTALIQTIFAGSFVLVYPVAIFVALPFGWAHAFYHNISIVGTSAKSTVKSSLNEAAGLSRLWPKQNHFILGFQFAGWFFLAANLAVFFIMIPGLLSMFFGLSTVFEDNEAAWANSSFYLDLFVFCYLILNPFSKAVYALRSFYGRSRLSGADLKAELRRQNLTRRETVGVRAMATLVVMVALSFAPTVNADPSAAPAPQTTPTPAPVVSPAPAPQAMPTPAPVVSTAPAGDTDKLDRAIEKTLKKDEFAWRMPRFENGTPEKEGFFQRMLTRFYKWMQDVMDKVMKPLRDFLKWLFDSKKKHDSMDKTFSVMEAIPWKLIFIVILLGVVGWLAFLILRHIQRQRANPTASLAQAPVRTVDLEAEDVRADDLPEDSWLALARQLMEKGDLRLALRAFYLATLSALARAQLVRLAASKSNRDYLMEVTRRLRGNKEAVRPFQENINLFEASWYGTHDVNSSILETMMANHQQVRTHATA